MVTVVLTTYNGEAFVADTINSVLNQTFSDFELLILDDASTDGTVAIVESYDDPRIVLVKNASNLGISRTRNQGTALARGRYIAAHDHDDISYPDRLERQVSLLDSRPGTVLVCGRAQQIPSAKEAMPSLPVPGPTRLAWTLFTTSPIVHSTVCIRKSALLDYNINYDPTYHYAEDFELYHKLSEIGDLYMLPEVLGAYRVHEANTSRTNSYAMTANGQQFLRRRYNHYLGPDTVSEADIEVIWRLFVEKHPARSGSELIKAGSILDQLVSRYVEQNEIVADERTEVFTEASATWEKTIMLAAFHHGPAILRYRHRFERLRRRPTGSFGHHFAGANATCRFLFNKLRRIQV